MLDGAGITNDSNYTPSPQFKQFLVDKLCINKEFGIPLVTKKEIGQYLTKLDTKKATGMDNISSCLLKDTKGVTIEALCNIVNTSIEAGIFPTCWKRAKVVPLHKSGSHDNMDNFIYQFYLLPPKYWKSMCINIYILILIQIIFYAKHSLVLDKLIPVVLA